MTAELRWIFLLLHFTAAAAGLNPSSVTVRDGAGVTLPCFTGTGDQRRCDGTDWTFAASGSRAVVTVFEGGKFHADVRSKSDRLRVTEECSLVIEKVSVDDAGLYTCRQFDSSGRHQGGDAVVLLSVVSMTEQEVGDDDEVTLTCSVRSYDGRCEHSVQWLFDDEDKNKETSQFSCSDSVKIQTSEFNQKMKSLRCNVTDRHGNKKLFEFKTQRSTGGDTTTTTTTTATATTTTTTATTTVTTTTTTTATTTATTATTNNMTKETNHSPGWWWQRLIIVAAGLAALTTSVLTVNIWTRCKGNQTQTEVNTLHDDVGADEEEGEDVVIYEIIT